MYSNSTQDVVNPLLYQGFIEETVELLELDQPQFSVCLIIKYQYFFKMIIKLCSWYIGEGFLNLNMYITCLSYVNYHFLKQLISL